MTSALENTALRVEINESNGLLTIIDKISGTQWGADPWEQSAGELTLKDQQGKPVKYDLKNAAKIAVAARGNNTAQLSFSGLRAEDGSSSDAAVAIRLELKGDDPELHVIVESITFDEGRFSLLNLLYPQRQCALDFDHDKGYQAIPYGQGCIIHCGRFKRPLRNEWHVWDDLSWQATGVAWGTEGGLADVPIYGWNALSMPWYGAVKNGSAFVCVVDTENNASVRAIMNYNGQDGFKKELKKSPYSRLCVCSTRFSGEWGKLGYERKQIYRFFPKGSHVEMAKFYRGIAEKKGLLKKLSEKIERFPATKNLLGALMINVDGGYPWYTDYKSMMYTWKDLRKVVDDMHNNLKVEHAVVCSWGGYAKCPPESLPFHPEFGTEQELHDLVQHIQDLGWLYITYQGYPANLYHADSFDLNESTFSVNKKVGGRWGGRCSGTYMKYASRDLPKMREITGQLADYQDIVSCSGLGECYNPEHPHSATEDARIKADLFNFIHSLGMITGSEVIQGFLAPDVEYFKGGINVGLRWFLLNHIHAPLYNLVFHDCLVDFDGTVGTSRLKEYSNETLECMAYGINPNFSFNMPHYEGAREMIRQHAMVYSDFLRKVALEELTSHAYLMDGYDVQQTTFAGGERVTINTDTAPVSVDGLEVPARGFVVEGDGPARRASIRTRFTKARKG